MPRPQIVAKLHELKYELRRSRLDPAELPKLEAEYENLIAEACRQFGCSKVELLRAINPDFAKWIRDEQMPPLEAPIDRSQLPLL